MYHLVICPDCAEAHSEPAEAHLGIAIRCADCLMLFEIELLHYEPVGIDEAA